MKWKLLSLFLTLVLCIGMLPTAVLAESSIVASGTCGTSLTWSLDSSGTLTISGTGSMTDYSNNYSAIPWTSWEDEFTTLVIEDGVTAITRYAFANCTALETVVLPENMQTLPEAMFYGCTSLASVTLPGQLTKIGDNAFYKCTSLKTISFPETLSVIGKKAFMCAGLTSVMLPDSVTELTGDHVFSSCEALTSVTLGKGLRIIPESTFGDCSSLETMVIPANIYQIDMYAFRRSGLKTLVILSPNCSIYVPSSSNNAVGGTMPADTILHSFTGSWGTYNQYSYSVQGYASATGSTFHLLEVATCETPIRCKVEGCGICIGEPVSHTPAETVQENVVPATCGKAGSYDEVVYCSACEKELSRTEKTIDKLTTHTAGTTVRENEVDATCTNPASYEEVVYCSVCDAELSRETQTDGTLLPHSFETKESGVLAKAATCTEAASYYVQCDNCETVSDTYMVSVGEAAGHSMGDWAMETQAGYLLEGLERRDCGRCDHYEERPLPATGAAVVAGIIVTRDGAEFCLQNVPEDLIVIVAAYSSNRMTTARISVPTAGERTISLPETAEHAAVKIFFLNSLLQPIAPAREA